MRTILNIEKTLYQIRDKLIKDEIIKKLLFVQDPAALSSTATITSANMESLITITPYIEEAEGIAESHKSIFIVIYPKNVRFFNHQNTVSFSIDIFVEKTYYLLNNNQMRLLQILNRVVDLLNDTKMSFAEKIRIDNCTLNSINDGKLIGFMTNWEIADGDSTPQY